MTVSGPSASSSARCSGVNIEFCAHIYGLRNRSGSLAIFAAIRRASSLVSSLVLMSASPPKADID